MIQIGDPVIPWSSFRECQDEKVVVLIDKGVERVIGKTTEEVVAIDWAGQTVFRRKQTLQTETDQVGNVVASCVLDPATFRPLQHHSEFEQSGTVTFDYSTLDQEVFDFLTVEMLLRVLKYQDGFAETLLAYHPWQASVMEIKIKAVRQENYLGRRCWVVDVVFGSYPQTYWISEETQELLIQSSSIGPDLIMEFRRI